MQQFGFWRTALRAAGMPSPPAREFELALGERVDVARRLHARAIATAEIAVMLGVSAATVRAYLRATTCACGAPIVRRDARACRGCARAARRPAWDRETILAAYRRWRELTGARPVRADWSPDRPGADRWRRERPRWPSAGEVVSAFGSWGALREAAGDAPAVIGAEDVLQALRELAAQLGRAPKLAELPRSGAAARHVIRARFAGLGDALAHAGITVEQHRYSNQQLLAALHAAARPGHVPRHCDVRAAPGERSADAIARRFGGWQQALRAAGLVRAQRPGRAAIIAALRDAAAAGEPLSYIRWRERQQPPTTGDIEREFGCWSDALRAADLTPKPRPGPEAIIAALRDAAADNAGRPPTANAWRQRRHGPTIHDIEREFQTYNHALQAAKLPTRPQVAQPRPSRRAGRS